jgi:iron uptake system component EfeO
VLAASFPERDAAIGTHPYAFPGGETDHGFKGFHKVEALLFQDEDLAAALPVTEELEGSLAALVEDLQARETFSAKKTFEELLALSTEFGAKKISSEEETWSDRSLLIFRHNFLGIESQFRPFAPEVARRRLQAAEAARHAYRQAMAAVDAVYGPEPDGRPYSGVRTADRRAIARGTYACRDALAASAEVLGLA